MTCIEESKFRFKFDPMKARST